ncbi:MAG: HNH endonuclease [Planctomycetota bacterium]
MTAVGNIAFVAWQNMIYRSQNPLVLFIFAFLAVFLSAPLFRRLALRFNILDVPNHRKIHKESTPLLGGLAVYAGVVFGLALNTADLRLSSGLVIGSTIILVIGVIDDVKGLSATFRLLVQFAAAMIMIGSGVRFSFLPNNSLGNAGEVVLTLVWVIGITNALNYLDGIDGLAAGVACIITLFFSIICYQTNQIGLALANMALAASCLGFLPHNFMKAKMFLGSAGSTFIGFAIAGMAVMGEWAQDNVVKLAVPILVLGVPIFDMVLTTIMRIKEEKVSTIIEWLKYAGKDHFHHRLIDLGLRPTEAAFFIYCVSISFGIGAIAVSNEKAVIGILSIVQAFIIFTAIAILMVVGNRIRAHENAEEMAIAETRLKEIALERQKKIDETNVFYASAQWQLLREVVITEQGRICQECERSIRDDFDLTVDHIKPKDEYPELALDKSNLQILCRSCYSAKGATQEESNMTTV